MSAHDELMRLADLLATAQKTSRFTDGVTMAVRQEQSESGEDQYVLVGSSHDGTVRYSAGPYSARVAAQHVQSYLSLAVGD